MKEQVIIIPVHNQLQYVKDCLASVHKMTPNPTIIIVNDGSDSETSTWLHLRQGSYFDILIVHEKAMGFSTACNDGIAYALDHYDFDVLCLLNSDTEIRTHDWFSKVEWYFLNGDKIGLASVMSDNALAQTVRHYAQYMKSIDDKPAVQSYLLHGFCYFMSKAIIEDIGVLDAEVFPHYGSEDDYSLRALKKGYTNLLVGKVFVHHANSKSYTDAQRSRIVQYSLPALIKRWGKDTVNRCGLASVRAGNYVNNYQPKPQPNAKM